MGSIGTSKKIITVFGATGNQGSGVINTVLAAPHLNETYALRAVTRDLTSSKAQDLQERGVEVVKGDFNDIESLKVAVRGSYGGFGVTDFWSIHSYDLEVKHGINIFEACKAEGIQHYVFSSLPSATKLSDGVLKHLVHFESKAVVERHIEANKGNMIASYLWPGMFLSFLPNLISSRNGTPTMTLPFPSDSIAWPLIDPPQDLGKYVMGLVECGRQADGVKVNAVSCWTTPKQLVAALSKESGRKVEFKPVPADIFAAAYPENLAAELTETLRIAGEYSVFGPGAELGQAQHDAWLLQGSEKPVTLEEWVSQNGPWTFEKTSFLDVLADQKRQQLEEAKQIVA